MDIICLIKQVPDTTNVKIDPKTGTLIREGVPSIINPDDKHGIEAALQLKDKFGGKVTVVTMGPPQAEDALKEAYAMGADDVVLLCDRAFAGADTLATSYALATAVKSLGKFDLLICGRQAIDGDTAQIGPQVAEYLGLPQITYVRKIEFKDGKVKVERATEEGFEVIEAKTPALLTVIGELNIPRYPTVKRILDANRVLKIPVKTAKDIGAVETKIGLKGSPTLVKRTFAPVPKGKGEFIAGKTGDEKVQVLINKLREKNVIGRCW